MVREKRLGQAQATASKRTLLLAQIKTATANLYVLVQSKMVTATIVAEDSTTLQLSKIGLFIQDLTEMIQEYETDKSDKTKTVGAS